LLNGFAVMGQKILVDPNLEAPPASEIVTMVTPSDIMGSVWVKSIRARAACYLFFQALERGIDST
jgi:hypothetical protein